MVIAFQIEIGGRGPGEVYRLRAIAAGRSAEAALELPSLMGNVEEQGRALGRAVFAPATRQLLLDVARGADEAGARIQLQLRVAPPELVGLPWEWMSLGSQTLWQPAIRDDYALVRVGQAAGPPALTTAAPLRLLIAAAPGYDGAADALGAALLGEVRARRLIVDRLRDADQAGLADALAEEPCHLLHLIGPLAAGTGGGPARAGQPRLRLGRSLDPQALAGILEESAGLRLVTLAAAEPGSEEALAGFAAALHEQSGLATLALADPAGATAFVAVCYRAIVAGEPADLAATTGRASLAEAGGAWGAPLIYLAPGGEELFRIGAEYAAPTPPPARQPAPRRAAPRPRPADGSRSARRPARDDDYPTRPFQPLARPQPRPSAGRRADAEPSVPRLSPRLIALIVASIILILMVGRSLRRPDSNAPAAPTAPASPTAPLTTPRGQGGATAPPGGAAGAYSAAIAALPSPTIGVPPSPTAAARGNPLDAPPPMRFATYLAAAGDSAETIAARAGSDPQAIVAINRLTAGQPLRPGQPLAVPLYRPGEALPEAPIVARGSPARPEVALTFDIEIDDVTLYGILDILDARGLRGTFFVTGRWAKYYPAAARRIVAEGHEIANHSLTHPFFTKIGLDGVAPELDQTEQIVREVTGVSTRPYFRFPYGASSQAAVDIIAADGYVPYHWSADDDAIAGWLDRAAADPAQAYGGILLMHGRQSTVAALPSWLDRLAALGLRPVTLGEVLE